MCAHLGNKIPIKIKPANRTLKNPPPRPEGTRLEKEKVKTSQIERRVENEKL